MQREIRFDVGGHVERAGGESDDGGVVFGDEFIFGEAFDVKEEIGGKRVEKTIAFPGVHLLLRVAAVVFGEDGGERDLGDDVLFELVLEERSGGEVQCQHQVAGDIHEDFAGFFEAKTVASVGFCGDLLRFDL